MSAELPTLRLAGPRVWVRTVQRDDLAGYRVAVEQSRERVRRWNPTDAAELANQLAVQGPDRRTFVIHARAVEGDHDIVGRVNVTGVVRGRFRSASMGYDAYDPYAGRGLFAEGLRLVVSCALADPAGSPPGLGLHRVEASVQPGNTRSASLLRSLGFQQEGYSPRMLWLADAAGREAWRDSLRFAVTREQWPGIPYAPRPARRAVALVTGAPEAERRRLARELSRELAVPLLNADVPRALVWSILAASPVGAVVEHRCAPLPAGWAKSDTNSLPDPDPAAAAVEAGLASAGLDAAAVPELWCTAGRAGPSQPGPVGVGPLLRVDAAGPVPAAIVVRLALQVGATAG